MQDIPNTTGVNQYFFSSRVIVRFLDAPDSSQIYDDKDYWIVPEEEEDSMEGEEGAHGALLMDEKINA